MKTFIWLVRREMWENRSIWLVPLAITLLLLLAFIGAVLAAWVYGDDVLIRTSGISRAGLHQDTRQALLMFFTGLTALFNLVLIITVIRYLLHSLYSDRKDRSILFWRSLPVSDGITVGSKLAVAMLVAPLCTFGFLLLTQLVGAAALSAIATQTGYSATQLVWGEHHLTSIWAFALPALLIQSLWYLPFYGWLAMASAWARQAPVLWATVPPLVAGVIEALLFQTDHFFGLMAGHAKSLLPMAFRIDIEIGHDTGVKMEDVSAFSMHNLAAWIGSAGMWIGVAIGIIFVAAAIAIRRYRAEDF